MIGARFSSWKRVRGFYTVSFMRPESMMYTTFLIVKLVSAMLVLMMHLLCSEGS